MKKAAVILSALILTSILFTSCQKAKEPEQKKEAEVQQAQIEEVKQKPAETKPLETKPEVQPKQQPPVAKEVKEEKKETSKEIKLSPLTEKEQKLVERIGENILIAPSEYFDSQEDAIEYLKPLLKVDHKNIRLYKGYEALSEDKRKQDYDEALSKAIISLDPKTKMGSEFIIEILKTRREYPRALSEAAKAVKFTKDNRVIPLLKKVVKHQDTTVRIEAAGSLLSLGDAETALPVLDELTKEGATAALGEIFHNMQGKEWEQRGINLIKKALTYKNNESRALAALFLIGLTKKGILKENLIKLEDILIQISEEILAKKKWPISSYGYSDHRALESVILAFEELGSKKAIPILKRIAAHPEASYLDTRANDTAKHIESSSGRKQQ